MSRLISPFIGFDELFYNALNGASPKPSNFPPYDIVKKDNKTFVVIAVAGYQRDELSVEVAEEKLTITGVKTNTDEDFEYLHQGIGKRNFYHEFRLNHHMVVEDVSLVDGLLKITLEKHLPENLKPKKLPIN